MRKRNLLFVCFLLLFVALNLSAVRAADEESLGKEAEQVGNLREAVTHYISALQSVSEGSSKDRQLREKIISLVQKLTPLPAVPEEAQRHLGRGQAAVEIAKTSEDFLVAVSEFKKALHLAPWLANAYFNLAVVQEKAGQFNEAIQNFKLYLLAAPSAADAQEVKTKIYGLELKAERQQKEVQEKIAREKMEFVLVKGGCFQMGDTFGDGESYEKPVHEACVDDIYIGKYEVTQGQWKAIMGNNPSNFKDCGDNCPVEQVSYDDIQEYINKLNQKTGKKYRLPTEAEWEYAARSGGKNEKYSGSNDIDSVAWYDKNSGSKTHPVGQKQPNGLGLYDMSGNVWEWVQDWYDSGYYKNSPKNNPKGSDSGEYRALRGGSWYNRPQFLRASNRGRIEPADRIGNGGFRLALSAQ